MPEVIMVASWRVMTVSSAALTRPKERSALSTDFFSASSMTFRPWPAQLLGDGVLGRRP